MYRRRQAPGAHVEEQSASSSPRTRSLRPPGWLYKPGALRSLDVCLDLNGPFIDVSFVVLVFLRRRRTRNVVSSYRRPVVPARSAIVGAAVVRSRPAAAV